jgi:hypothetical protein
MDPYMVEWARVSKLGSIPMEIVQERGARARGERACRPGPGRSLLSSGLRRGPRTLSDLLVAAHSSW